MAKRWTVMMMALLIGATLLTSSAFAYETEDFGDVSEDHWAYDAIMTGADLGLMGGMGDGRFGPGEALTSGQFLAMVGRAFYPKDCDETGTLYWWDTYYENAVKKGIVVESDFADTNSLVSGPPMAFGISRGQVARILVRVDEKLSRNRAIEEETDLIADYEIIPEELQYYVAQAFAKELLQGDQNGNFNYHKVLTRAEAATVLIRLLEAAGKI